MGIADTTEMVLETVKNNIHKHLQCRTKYYVEDDAEEFQKGALVLVFLHTRGIPGISKKLTPA